MRVAVTLLALAVAGTVAGAAVAYAPESSPRPMARPQSGAAGSPGMAEAVQAAARAQGGADGGVAPFGAMGPDLAAAVAEALDAAAAAPAPVLSASPYAPSTSPRPAERPAVLAAALAAAPAPPSPGAAGLPRRATALAVTASPRPAARSAAAAQAFLRRVAVPPRPSAGGAQICGTPGLVGRSIARVTSSNPGCGIANPVRLEAVDGVSLSVPATLHCDTAIALQRWLREAARPAIGNSGGGIAEIYVAAHYACRARNHRPGARISEHGLGRAIDISALELRDGTTISVLRDWRRGPYSQRLRQMHRQACGIFTTTLGPGSDGMHEDHFHYDVAVRRNRSTYCR